jgi:hypothetical protein
MVSARRRAGAWWLFGVILWLTISAVIYLLSTSPRMSPGPVKSPAVESTPKYVPVATWHACHEFEKAFRSGEMDARQGRLAAVKRIEVWTSEEENSDAIRYAGLDLKNSIENPVRDERWIETADAFRTACHEAGVSG